VVNQELVDFRSEMEAKTKAKLIDLPGLPRNVMASYNIDLNVIEHLTDKAIKLHYGQAGPKIKIFEKEGWDTDSFGTFSEEEETKIDPKLYQVREALKAGDLDLYWKIREGESFDYKAMLKSNIPKIGEKIFKT
jgi:hypothetical protein